MNTKAPKASKAAHMHTTGAAKASKAPKASKAAHMHTTGAAKEGKDAGKAKGGKSKDAKGNKHDGHNHGDDAENKMSGSGDAAAFMSSDSDVKTSHVAGGAMFAVAGILVAVGVAIKAGRDRRP